MSPEINLNEFFASFRHLFPEVETHNPWKFLRHLSEHVSGKIRTLGDEYVITNDVAVHKTAQVEQHAVIKGPVIIGANSFVASHAYLRGGVIIGDNCVIGPGVEIKSSVILSSSSIAHFNFIGDSIIGSDVNMEAGAVVSNHYNERKEKTIFILIGGLSTAIPLKKFGAIVGDRSRIGANAVISPGTLLFPESVVKRLELVEQNPL